MVKICKQAVTPRRSVKTQEGRTHCCLYCERGYLSIRALTRHLRERHSYNKVVPLCCFQYAEEVLAVRDQFEEDPYLSKNGLYYMLRQLTEEKAGQKRAEVVSCDYALAKYLIWVTSDDNEKTLGRILKFVLMYRRSLNAWGYPKFHNPDDKRIENRQFSAVFDSDIIPDISNEFVTFWHHKKRRPLLFQKKVLIDMTQRMCSWLFNKGYTTSRITATQ